MSLNSLAFILIGLVLGVCMAFIIIGLYQALGGYYRTRFFDDSGDW